jgi:integral membrane sensor domain MASE1
MQSKYILKIEKLADLASQARALYMAMFISIIVIGVFLSKIYIHSQIIPIWIPAGIALIGCYLWWWRFFPAVFIAAFIINCSTDPDFQLIDIFSDTGIQNSIIAASALIQAAVGSALLRYWLGNPINEWNKKKLSILYSSLEFSLILSQPTLVLIH